MTRWGSTWTCWGLLVAGAVLLACDESPSSSSPRLLQFYTCGDPVCRAHRPQPDVPACTTEKVGEPCATSGVACDPGDECNRRIVCAAEDPATICPISRLRHKRDVEYLGAPDLARLHDDLLRFRLASYAYRGSDPSEAPHLGFIIDDVAPSPAVLGRSGDRVDLYGYTSMAVAALQTQARQIEALQEELDALKREIAGRDCSAGTGSTPGR